MICPAKFNSNTHRFNFLTPASCNFESPHYPTKPKDFPKIFNKGMENKDNQSSSLSVTEVLLKNVTQPIPIVLIATHIFLLFEVATVI